MDEAFFNEAMDAVGLKPIYVNGRISLDEPCSKIKSLHPTLRKCQCGYIASSHLVTKHIETLLAARRMGGEEPQVFWSQHGEVPLNEDEGNEWQNKKWLEGTHKNYND